jgi:chorismate mutase
MPDPQYDAAVTADPDLAVLRQRIDDVDRRILALVAERVRIVFDVAEFKRQRGLPVYDPERERTMLDSLTALAPPELEPQTVRRIFERLIDESRRLEQLRLGNK